VAAVKIGKLSGFFYF